MVSGLLVFCYFTTAQLKSKYYLIIDLFPFGSSSFQGVWIYKTKDSVDRVIGNQ